MSVNRNRVANKKQYLCDSDVKARTMKPSELAPILLRKLEAWKRQQEALIELKHKQLEDLASVLENIFSFAEADDNPQTILDEHVSRMQSDLTPSRSPGLISLQPKSPESRRRPMPGASVLGKDLASGLENIPSLREAGDNPQTILGGGEVEDAEYECTAQECKKQKYLRQLKIMEKEHEMKLEILRMEKETAELNQELARRQLSAFSENRWYSSQLGDFGSGAGGSFGKMEAGREEEYFYKKQKEQLKKLIEDLENISKFHEQQIKRNQEAVSRLKQRV